MSALQQWAGEVEDLFGVSCRFQCFTPVLIHDDTVATHLYYIAREAVNNAIKHGHASQIVIRLAADEEQGALTITDDGSGIADIPANNAGMGLHLMNYRARMIGGSLRDPARRDRRDHGDLLVSGPSYAGIKSRSKMQGVKNEDRHEHQLQIAEPRGAEKKQNSGGGRSSHRAPGPGAADQPGSRPGGLRRSRRSHGRDARAGFRPSPTFSSWIFRSTARTASIC